LVVAFEDQQLTIRSVVSPEPALQVEPVLAENQEIAHVLARSALNNLLDRIIAQTQYPGELTRGFRFTNLDNAENSGVAVIAGVATWFSQVPQIPDGQDISASFRAAAYLRRGDLSNDPFDSFRCYYLAVDCIGKQLVGSCADREVLERSLPHVCSMQTIQTLAAKVEHVNVADSGLGDVEKVTRKLYKAFRCSLMHAGGSDDLTPFNPHDEAAVVSVLDVMRGIAWQYVKHTRHRFVV
jgi:hypothetical protein